jgi:beta-1,4-mannosyltransferase
MLHLLRFVTRIDLLFLNWIEDLPAMKGGYAQSLLFILIMSLKSLCGFKIVWTMHNKVSHSQNHFWMKKRLFEMLLVKSDLIITHSSEGFHYALDIKPDIKKEKVFVFQHPISPVPRRIVRKKEYDILIWGTLAPYKGVHRFLEYLVLNGLSERFRIRILGKCSSDQYYETLARYQNAHIVVENRFLKRAEIEELIATARVTLFTYSERSVLSSGALMDSIACRANVVGPDVGAFKDLAGKGLIKTYRKFEDLPDIIDSIKAEPGDEFATRIDEFLNAHSWEEFGAALIKKLNVMEAKKSRK